MSEGCHAITRVKAAFGTDGQIKCDLPMTHQGALHYDQALHVFWMAAMPGQVVAEDVPAALRMNENIPAALQGEWLR